MKGLVRGWNVGCGRKASWQLWVDLRRGPHAVKLAAAADAAVLDVEAATDASLPVVRHDVNVGNDDFVTTQSSRAKGAVQKVAFFSCLQKGCARSARGA